MLVNPIENVSLIADILLLIELSILTYISTKYPECMLLSHIQILRALELYKIVSPSQIDNKANQTKKVILEYLNSAPEISTTLLLS